MAVTVNDIKNSLRIDVTNDDDMIQTYINTAIDYVINAVDSSKSATDFAGYKQFDFAVSLLTQFWYSNRNIDMQNTPYQVVSMIQQLRGIV
ncbi:head-tail connector protein [Lentilactobacillus kefiri]|uniref:head-tail connector protein n=1 Tax=Lentilactobacillus kefiri TaxID=33962 RepID=UPI0021C3B791|nr:head-tail connector protein [Lentilactobacillus kefiri]MCP9370018.1 head-tail connector protein [Lentilactobacillus kefiri]